ncbi:MAG: hypothetical protein JNJ59_03665 [Deltaproteobacteria bacterium]|nr:hypothetical protein [Deltaproteobacteria bacterium]
MRTSTEYTQTFLARAALLLSVSVTVACSEDQTAIDAEVDTSGEVEPDTSPALDTEDAASQDTDPGPDTAPEDVAELPDLAEPEPEIAEPDTTPDLSEPDVAPEVTDVAVDTTEPYDCAGDPPLPLPVETLTGFTGSEDFAFDAAGYVYSVDAAGNLLRELADGLGNLVVPNVSTFAAGIAFLPDGDLVIAAADLNALLRIGKNGSKRVILAGLQYPNGLDIDPEGFIYVAEQDAGRVRRVDSETGTFEILADGLANPNGVSFGVGYRRLYVGSFGGGTITAIDKDASGLWGTPYLWTHLPDIVPPPPPLDTCAGLEVGAPCFTLASLYGTCQRLSAAAPLRCEARANGVDPLAAACDGHADGDRCEVLIGGKTYDSHCNDYGWGVVCDLAVSDSAACTGLAIGEACVAFELASATFGMCLAAESLPSGLGYPSRGVFCVAPSTLADSRGGLDGVNVDACGDVYATEYVRGVVWKFDGVSGTPTIAAQLPSSWVPNLHWGSGVGGWDARTLYVFEREQGRVFGLHVGRPGKQATVAWPAP